MSLSGISGIFSSKMSDLRPCFCFSAGLHFVLYIMAGKKENSRDLRSGSAENLRLAYHIVGKHVVGHPCVTNCLAICCLLLFAGQVA